MSITRLRTKEQAWIKFLEQWLANNDGNGYKIYRMMLRQDLNILLEEWQLFIDDQYRLGWISEDQHEKYSRSLPKKLNQVVRKRKSRGTL